MKDGEGGSRIGRKSLRQRCRSGNISTSPYPQGALEPRLPVRGVLLWAETGRPLKLVVLSHWLRAAWEDKA